MSRGRARAARFAEALVALLEDAPGVQAAELEEECVVAVETTEGALLLIEVRAAAR